MKAYKFRIKPTKTIAYTFECWLDGCRELYNAALQERRDAWKVSRVSVNYHTQVIQLPEIKQSRQDLAQINAQVLQDTLRKLSKTFDAFFRRVKAGETPGYPRFKGKRFFNSFTFPQMKGSLRIEGKHLSKIGKVKIIEHREITGGIKTCTIKQEADGWYAIFAVEENQSPYFPNTGESCGIDVGIENFATLSTGEPPIDNPRWLRQAEKRLKTTQRQVSRRKKGSARRRKSVELLAKKHLKVKRQRKDFFHKTSLELIKRFDEIAVEDLNIKGLVQNHHLAKSISDASWGTFLSVLENKAANAGRRVWRVPAHFTSQDCRACGARMKLTLAMRVFKCTECGHRDSRDTNAARNIKARAVPSGMEAVALPREPRTPSMKPSALADGDVTMLRLF
jgi:putative transposase